MLNKFNLTIGNSVEGQQMFIKAILKLLVDVEYVQVFEQTFHLAKLACQKIVAFLPNQYRASTVFLAVEAVRPNFCKVS